MLAHSIHSQYDKNALVSVLAKQAQAVHYREGFAIKKLYIDLETFSETPITHGTHAYAENAEIMLFAWALDDNVVNVWDCTADPTVPADLLNAFEDSSVEIWAHNSHFDRTVLAHAAPFPAALRAAKVISRWRDTMVKAFAHSLPGALGTLCEVFKLSTDQAKDKEGRQLVHLFCKPHSETSKIHRATRKTHPAQWAKFVEYARLDIEAMRAIDQKLPNWNYRDAELALWHLDQCINDRGFLVDTALAHAAIKTVNREQKKLATRTQELTEGEVNTATQRDALLRHLLKAYDVDLPDLQKSTLERRVNDLTLPSGLRELLAIRLQASTTSTSKYKTLVNGVSKDDRLRGTLQFNGAHRTGRWAGRLFQPQNIPKPALSQSHIKIGIDAIKADCADLIFDNVMELTSSAIRGSIIAPQGKKLVIADLANIEGRVLAWLAGEEWKLKAFRDFDAGIGQDLYKLAFAKSFGIKPENVTDENRQVGKVQELALGYEGGVGAFLTFSAVYRIDLEAMSKQAIGSIPAPLLAEAEKALAWTRLMKRPTFGLSDRAWLVCDSFKRSWRYAHPKITSFWKELEEAARSAILCPGITFTCRRLKLQRDGAWLRIHLPSGRYLCYPSPQVSEAEKISYMGVDQYTRKWSRLNTYGGKLAENITQAVSRDLLAAHMQAIDDEGYRIVLSVHDELITETPDSEEFNVDHLIAMMSTNPVWASELPLAAKGFQTYRYKKG
ncbi:MAG: DNA polymerase [Glomeribacter sp. 1016415]|nr:DNA polymerase [Glomeribacter sp. 1016415]